MKKGFVFLETLLLITVLTGTVLALYSNYITVTTNISSRVNYDRISDLYKVDVIRSYFKSDISLDSNINVNSSNCLTYMNGECSSILDLLDVKEIYILNDINNVSDVTNSMKLYLKTINDSDSSHYYIVVQFKIDNDNYYGSLRFR